LAYQKKLTILIFIDTFIVLLSVYSSYYFRFTGDIPPSYQSQLWIYSLYSMIFYIGFFIFFRLYNRMWQYASVGELFSIARAVTLGCVASTLAVYLHTGQAVPLSVTLRTYETVLLLMGGIRFAWRIYRDNYYKRGSNQRKALIVGAGDCGAIIAKELKHNLASKQYPVGFVDDSASKAKLQVYGLPVLGNREQIPELVEKYGIDDIVIAIPSAPKEQIAEILHICKQTPSKLKIIPQIHDLIEGKIGIQTMRDVDVEDLLGRDPIKADLEGIANYVENKVVLVTGAGGSIGSEICRQIAPFRPKQLLLLGHGENSIYAIENEMQQLFPYTPIVSIIADIQDRERMTEVFLTYQPKVVFHAAAHKHVPLMEKNPSEAIKNNVFGTRNVADCANLYGAERFVLISSDKAVNPTSIMGATKRIAEMYVQSLNQTSETKFAAVRFGNVLGSRGSVIPRFKEQIARGGPVTITHPDMVRYFMTIPEAVQLVIQAGAFAKGGEIFVLDMGQPVRILDLAQDLIRLSGFEPYDDIMIDFTGMRPGEKLYEELLTSEEGLTATTHNRIFIGKPGAINYKQVEFEIKSLEKVVEQDQSVIRDVVKHIVPSYQNVS
jgi:FlaA1/EpsC-like NDP-sugar epimerase